MSNRQLAILLSTLILASCGGGPTGADEKKVASFRDSAAAPSALCNSFDIAQFATDSSRAALIADSFLTFYRHDDAVGSFSADAASISILKDVMMAFEGLAPDFDPATQCLGVRIAYGLDNGARPIFLFAPVAMTRVPSAEDSLSFRLDAPTQWYNPAGGDWQLMSASEADAAMKRYASRVLKYVDGTLTPLRIDPRLGSASDPSSTFFPFAEFKELIRENEEILEKATQDGTERRAISAVRLRWAAEVLGDGAALKQVVVIVPVLDRPTQPNQDLPLRLKAANFNHLCPSECEGSTVSYQARRTP